MKYYWTTKEGRKIDVDEMSTEHLRNTLKMILRNIDNAKSKPKPNSLGNIEACFQEEMYKEWEEEHYSLHQAMQEFYSYTSTLQSQLLKPKRDENTRLD